MIIRRIALSHYRGIEQRDFEFDEGVNIIEGPNEAGKSSLAEALRLVFEYPDSSTHRSVVATHPVHVDEGPEVDIEFETGPYQLRYHKRYKRRPETTLEVRGPRSESLTGRDAHARAQEILDETIDVALWRSLQLQQGLAIEQADLRDREALSRALDAASGSDGEHSGDERGALFDRVRQEYLRYFTETGRVRGDRAELQAQAEKASAQVTELAARQRALTDDVAEAERLGGLLAELRRRLPELEAQASQLASDWDGVVRQRQECERATRNAEASQLRELAAGQAKRQRQQLAQDAEAAALGGAALEKRIETADAPLRRADVRWRELCEQQNQRRSELAASETRVRAARAAREAQGMEAELGRLLERIRNVGDLERELQTALESASAIRVDDAGMRALQEAELNVRHTRARLDESGTRVQLHALEDTKVIVTSGLEGSSPAAAENLERGGTRHFAVDQALTLTLPGSIEITVLEAAGDSDGESPRAAAAHAVAQRDRLLADFGVESLADAARAREERGRALQTVDWTRQNLEQALSGASTSELRAEAATLAETLARLREDNDQQQREEILDSDASDASDLQVLCEERDKGRAAFEHATALAETARTTREELRLDEMRLEGAIETAVAQTKALTDRLSELRRETPDELLALRSGETTRESSAALAQAKRLQEQLTALDADRLSALHTNAQEVVRAARAEEQARNLALAAVLARLEAQQEAGLFEELETARARSSALLRDHEAALRRARAAARLYLEMRHQRERARERYLQPLRERIERLGRIVFGSTFSVAMDSELRIESRTLEGRTVDFESLSTGAQEQIGLLTRLAVAMTVAPQGGVPLILDDALGNSDSLRLQSMGAMLSQAGRECQIIILTCSPERFRHVGGARVQRIKPNPSAITSAVPGD